MIWLCVYCHSIWKFKHIEGVFTFCYSQEKRTIFLKIASIWRRRILKQLWASQNFNCSRCICIWCSHGNEENYICFNSLTVTLSSFCYIFLLIFHWKKQKKLLFCCCYDNVDMISTNSFDKVKCSPNDLTFCLLS